MALNDFNRKRKEVGGTSRVQTADIGSQPLTRIGASGDGKNAITERGIQTGGAGDGMKRQRGRSTLEFGQRSTIDPSIRKRFRESPGFFAKEDVEKPTPELFAKREQKAIAEAARVRPRGTIRPEKKVIPTEEELRPREGRLTVTTRGDIEKLAGPRLRTGRMAKGGVTDIGEFKKGGKTLREIEKAGGVQKPVSPFSEKGIGQIFGSAAELAKLFTSKEFQQRKAKGIQAAAGAKGRRADAKAKTEKIKALSGVLEDLSVSGGDNKGLMATIQEQIQNLISGNDGSGMSGEIMGKLADQFEPDQVKTILGIMR